MPIRKRPNTYPVFEKIEDCDVEADVIIDFSNAAAADTLLDYAAARRLPLVLCTTGLSEEQLAHVEAAAKETAVLRSANMSMGINLLLKLLRDASRVLAPAGFDIEIVERHHNQKLDAPSGRRWPWRMPSTIPWIMLITMSMTEARCARSGRPKRSVFPLSGAGPLWGTTR